MFSSHHQDVWEPQQVARASGRPAPMPCGCEPQVVAPALRLGGPRPPRPVHRCRPGSTGSARCADYAPVVVVSLQSFNGNSAHSGRSPPFVVAAGVTADSTGKAASG